MAQNNQQGKHGNSQGSDSRGSQGGSSNEGSQGGSGSSAGNMNNEGGNE